MGSSEFEWGALPNSIKRIRKNRDNYVHINIHVGLLDTDIRILYPNEYSKEQIEDYLKSLSHGSPLLKERSCFVASFDFDPTRVDFWWDIQNDIMFWISANAFNVKFINVALNK